MIDSYEVGRKISSLRLNHNMTQEELAEKLYVTRQALSRWERGQAVPPVEIVVELGRIFHVSFDEILCLNESFEIDPDDIFKNHDRQLIINRIISGDLEVNIPDIFYQLSPLERIHILSKIRDGVITTNFEELIVKLTPSELKFLGGKKHE
ncbi:MAG: helix-turn-helix transcriptional regulator [Acholeplasmataceae bacterium]|jgi:transcriptional regulator with XRE-family HTH domain